MSGQVVDLFGGIEKIVVVSSSVGDRSVPVNSGANGNVQRLCGCRRGVAARRRSDSAHQSANCTGTCRILQIMWSMVSGDRGRMHTRLKSAELNLLGFCLRRRRGSQSRLWWHILRRPGMEIAWFASYCRDLWTPSECNHIPLVMGSKNVFPSLKPQEFEEPLN